LDKLLTSPNLEKTKLLKLAQAGIPNDMRGEIGECLSRLSLGFLKNTLTSHVLIAKIYCRLLKVDKMDGICFVCAQFLCSKLTYDYVFPTNTSDYDKNYEIALKRTHGAIIPDEPLPPLFGGRSYRSYMALTKEACLIADHVLCILAHDFPSLEYCPFIAPLVTLLCHQMETPDEVLGAMVSLVKQALHKDKTIPSASGGADSSSSKGTTKDWRYFPTFRKDTKYMSRAFGNLLNKQSAKLYHHISELQVNKADPIWANWLTDIFIGVLPMPLLWRVLDAFMIDGYKTLFKVGVAVILSQKNAIMKCTSIDALATLLTDASYTALTTPLSSAPPPSLSPECPNTTFAVDPICNAAWGVNVSVADVRNGIHHHISLQGISQSEDIHEAHYKYQRGIPKLRSLHQPTHGDTENDDGHSSSAVQSGHIRGSMIIKDEHWIAMWSWIPPHLRVCELELVFTTAVHGHHISTLFNRTEGKKPTIIVVETDKSVFGAFLPESWPTNDSGRSNYFGTGMLQSRLSLHLQPMDTHLHICKHVGETFLFTLEPYAKLYPWVGRDMDLTPYGSGPDDNARNAKIDLIRDKASFFMRATRKDIAIGGGG
jgi:hypothetical protein